VSDRYEFIDAEYAGTAADGGPAPTITCMCKWLAAAGVLCAFSCVVDALSEQCLRRRPAANLLVAAAFRTNWLQRERCAATCQRRRRPGQARRRQGRLQITAALRGLRLKTDR
jgi:hypothetical protein